VGRIDSENAQHYEVLGLQPYADQDWSKVKRAYHKLALKLHPDKNSAPGAVERFKQVNAAYTALQERANMHTLHSRDR
jgi:curved DNA-binding protein CbpA